jgi:hypothetical protein
MKTVRKQKYASIVPFAAGHVENKEDLPTGSLKRLNQAFARHVKPMRRSIKERHMSLYPEPTIIYNQQYQTDYNSQK